MSTSKAEEKLTEAQLNAIRAPIDQPLMILAAAGSGKTLVLCHRILHLISKGVSPNDILAVTFTRRAGQDILHKLQNVAVSQQHSKSAGSSHVVGIRVGTFHSFCLSVLRAFPNQAGLAPNFVVFTPKMQLDLLENILQEWYTQSKPQMEGQSMHFPGRLAEKSKHLQGRHQSTTEKAAFFKAEAHRLLQHLRRDCCKKPQGALTDAEIIRSDDDGLSNWVFQQYHKRLLEANGIDFNSFVRCTVNILQEWPNALEVAGLKAQYILVDEFQDTDIGQFELLRVLCNGHKHITIVGDDDQQIYSWRGAAGFYNIKMFEYVFAGATIAKLEQNFRSTGAIVASARSLIAKNKNRMPKTVRTASPTGMLMTICECRNDQCEVTAVADFILSLKEQGVPCHEIAILYRLQRIGLEIQQNLQVRGIECQFKGGGSGSPGNQFFPGSCGEVGIGPGDIFHDILAVLRLAICESDELACKRLLQIFCPSVSSIIADCLSCLHTKKGLSLFQAIKGTRSHLLGLLPCDDLSSCAPIKSISITSESDHLVLEGMHSILKLIATTKDDSKHLGMRDTIFNVLQQISYGRSSRDVPQCVNLDFDGKNGNNRQFVLLSQKVDAHSQHSLEYAGIKALLKEADLFDAEIITDSRNRTCVAIKESKSARRQLSYMDMKKQRSTNRRSQSSPDKVGFLGSTDFRLDADSSEKIKIFLDRVILKMHENDLGESNDLKFIATDEATPEGQACSTAVTLSTIHQAKGLEWTAVILVRANEGVMPVMDCDFVVEPSTPNAPKIIDHGTVCREIDIGMEVRSKAQLRSGMNRDGIFLLGPPIPEAQCISSCRSIREGIEEERRLMYVALTRAKRFILVTHVMMEGGQQMTPSRFLAEIPPGLIRRTTCYESNIPNPSASSISSTLLQPLNKEKMKKKSKVSSSESHSKSIHSNLGGETQYSSKRLKLFTPIMKRKVSPHHNISRSIGSETTHLKSPSDSSSLQCSSYKTGNDKVLKLKLDLSDSYSEDSDFEMSVKKERKGSQKLSICSDDDDI